MWPTIRGMVEAQPKAFRKRNLACGRGYRREIEETVTRIEKIETALEPKFHEHFVYAMALPNKVDSFPKLSSVVTLPERKGNVDGEGGEGGGRRRRRSRE